MQSLSMSSIWLKMFPYKEIYSLTSLLESLCDNFGLTYVGVL